MTKYFYTDPLAAAWMAKHHRMTMTAQLPSHTAHYLATQKLGNELHLIQDYLVSEANGPWHIHPDSLHLLKPQSGDLVYACPEDSGEGTFWRYELWGGDHVACSDYWSIDKIIQRNGVAFMWPESNAA